MLLCHRRAERALYPDVWDFPGGHVEAGEDTESALVRELREELGIEIARPQAPRLARFVNDNQDLSVWLITDWSGVIINAALEEHDDIRWFDAQEVGALEIADAVYLPVISRALNSTGRSPRPPH